MKIKEMLLISLSIASLVACSNNTTNNEDRDAMQILEAERVKNMTADEKMIYRVDKAKEKIDAMLETAKKARQEELDVGETKAKVEEALKNITEEK